MRAITNNPFVVVVLLSVSCFTMFSPPLPERNKETAIQYLKAYAEADLNTLDSVLHKDYRHYLFDIQKEDFDGLIQLVKKKGNVGEYRVLENFGCKDVVIIRWTFLNPPEEYSGISLFTFKGGKIGIEREYFKKIEGP